MWKAPHVQHLEAPCWDGTYGKVKPKNQWSQEDPLSPTRGRTYSPMEDDKLSLIFFYYYFLFILCYLETFIIRVMLAFDLMSCHISMV